MSVTFTHQIGGVDCFSHKLNLTNHTVLEVPKQSSFRFPLGRNVFLVTSSNRVLERFQVVAFTILSETFLLVLEPVENVADTDTDTDTE